MHRLATLEAGQYRINVFPVGFEIDDLVVQLLPCRCPPGGFKCVHPARFEAVHPVTASFETVHPVPAGFKAVHSAGSGFEADYYLSLKWSSPFGSRPTRNFSGVTRLLQFPWDVSQ